MTDAHGGCLPIPDSDLRALEDAIRIHDVCHPLSIGRDSLLALIARAKLAPVGTRGPLVECTSATTRYCPTCDAQRTYNRFGEGGAAVCVVCGRPATANMTTTMHTEPRVTRRECGWPLHFISGARCTFHRGTILSDGTHEVIVSTVGAMLRKDGCNVYEPIASGRHYETMAFMAGEPHKCGCPKADVAREIALESQSAMVHDYNKHDADAMHEVAVAEIESALRSGAFIAPKSWEP